jgi:hypothetical protein
MRVAMQIMPRHGYNPDLAKEAIKTELRQAEALAAEFR